MRTLLLVLCLSLLPANVFAQTCLAQDYAGNKEPDWECQAPGEDALVPRLQLTKMSKDLKLDEKAPFAGILMEPDRVIQIGIRVKALRKLLWMEMQKGWSTLEIEKKYLLDSSKAEANLLLAQRDSYKEQATQLRDDLIAEKKWYKSWSFGLVLGIVATAGATTALAVSLK